HVIVRSSGEPDDLIVKSVSRRNACRPRHLEGRQEQGGSIWILDRQEPRASLEEEGGRGVIRPVSDAMGAAREELRSPSTEHQGIRVERAQRLSHTERLLQVVPDDLLVLG